ncbi:helix-turn-helix domain-containing protein [Weissella paramesenteroides]|uniref:helix-turn-helix domain-containing protein n=1 Tax=Weissella paramesenteroides TaxID=1249 RepID=UPI00103B82FB|nr:helix-turn-helix transcriptional regulator [Weissella paramesenteroides]MDF8372103.1 helix-turn-helix transcriptional regulator [Weissella paramesenteroides]RZQ58530.1 XRE family transcriptional regulator [Weissella paramesenteroides]WIG65896.1 helix-turn-helix transcriptional regulator [Weissella paramesenteroides]
MNRIKELRKQNHYTLQNVADAVGVSNGTVANYENGKREPKLATWKKLADFFDVDVGYLQGMSTMDLGTLFNNVTEYVYLMNTDFYNSSKAKQDFGFYEQAFDYANEILKSAPYVDPITGNSILDYLDQVDIDDQTNLSEKDKELIDLHDQLISAFTSKKENFEANQLNNIKKIDELIEKNQNQIKRGAAQFKKLLEKNLYAQTAEKLLQRNDDIDEDEEFNITYKNELELVYYLHLVQDNLLALKRDKVSNAVSALKDVLDNDDVVISDELKEYFNKIHDVDDK